MVDDYTKIYRITYEKKGAYSGSTREWHKTNLGFSWEYMCPHIEENHYALYGYGYINSHYTKLICMSCAKKVGIFW